MLSPVKWFMLFMPQANILVHFIPTILIHVTPLCSCRMMALLSHCIWQHQHPAQVLGQTPQLLNGREKWQPALKQIIAIDTFVILHFKDLPTYNFNWVLSAEYEHRGQLLFLNFYIYLFYLIMYPYSLGKDPTLQAVLEIFVFWLVYNKYEVKHIKT